MKRFMLVIVSLTMAFTLFACVNGDGTDPNNPGSGNQVLDDHPDITFDSSVSFEYLQKVTDDNGDSVAIVAFVFTNYQSVPVSCDEQFTVKAFQNGAELPESNVLTVMMPGNEASNTSTKVDPNSSLFMETSFKLSDLSDVTIEFRYLNGELFLTKTQEIGKPAL
ncbi:MAG: DUF5067 domain-containing protein [Coriobacteriales bacterium]|jgi:hypothetical protein|nr:DUF5067 domain-containing protein [Coriobacteriales bacterium]